MPYAEQPDRPGGAEASGSDLAGLDGIGAALTRATGWRWAALGEARGDVAPLTLWERSDRLAPVRAALEGTPGADALRGALAAIDVAGRYPEDALLRALGAASWAGVPVGEGEAWVAVFDDHPRAPDAAVWAALDRAAAAAAVELRAAAFERRLSPEALSLRAAFAESPVGLWVIDAQGTSVHANRAMAELLGWSQGEMIGRPLFSFMDERARRVAEANLSRRNAGIVEAHEFRFRHRDGRDVWTALYTHPLRDRAGAVVGAAAVVLDQTASRHLEARVARAQRMDSLGALAGGIAHDFNNLLVGVSCNVELVLERPDLAEEARALLREAIEAAAQAAGLVRQLLAYAGGGSSQERVLDARQALDGLRPVLATAARPGVWVGLELGEGLPAVRADPTQLAQIVLNLVGNAVEATAVAGGQVRLRAEQVVLDQAALAALDLRGVPLTPGPHLRVSVTDSGPGVAEDLRERLFDPFFTTHELGRGLGLPAVLGLVRAHRGAVHVGEAPGGGACFSVYLPAVLEAPPVASPEPVVAAPAGGAPLRVLVVEDDLGVQRVCARALARRGHHVAIAGSLEEARARLADEPGWDVVVLDLVLPDGSGLELLDALAGAGAPGVVLSSGFSRASLPPGLIAARRVHFLAKPWRPDALCAAVAEVGRVSGPAAADGR
jgi:PAS domain S-box-containing protein